PFDAEGFFEVDAEGFLGARCNIFRKWSRLRRIDLESFSAMADSMRLERRHSITLVGNAGSSARRSRENSRGLALHQVVVPHLRDHLRLPDLFLRLAQRFALQGFGCADRASTVLKHGVVLEEDRSDESFLDTPADDHCTVPLQDH